MAIRFIKPFVNFVVKIARSQASFQHSHGIARTDPGHFPEVPSRRPPHHFAHVNQAIGGRLLQPAFPARNRGRRAAKNSCQLMLAQLEFLAKSLDAAGPVGYRRRKEFSRSGHKRRIRAEYIIDNSMKPGRTCSRNLPRLRSIRDLIQAL